MYDCFDGEGTASLHTINDLPPFHRDIAQMVQHAATIQIAAGREVPQNVMVFKGVGDEIEFIEVGDLMENNDTKTQLVALMRAKAAEAPVVVVMTTEMWCIKRPRRPELYEPPSEAADRAEGFMFIMLTADSSAVFVATIHRRAEDKVGSVLGPIHCINAESDSMFGFNLPFPTKDDAVEKMYAKSAN